MKNNSRYLRLPEVKAAECRDDSIFTRYLLPISGFILAVLFVLFSASLSNAATVTLYPDGEVSMTNFTGNPVTTPNSYQNVDDPAVDDTDYNTSTGTIGANFVVSMQSSIAYTDSTINSVTIYVRGTVVGGSGQNEQFDFRPVGDAFQGGQVLADDPTVSLYSAVYDDATYGWTPTDVDALQIEVNVTQVAVGEEVRVSEVYAIVDYTQNLEVSGFTATDLNTDGEVQLNWTNPSYAGFTAVKIVRSTGAPPPPGCSVGTVVYDGAVSPQTDSGLTNDTEYFYLACTYDTDTGTGGDQFSLGVSVSATPTLSKEATAFTATDLSTSGEIQLSWTNPSYTGFTAVKIVRTTGAAPLPGCSIGTVVYDGTVSPQTDSGLTNDTEYFYLACSYDTDTGTGGDQFSLGVGDSDIPTSGDPAPDTTITAPTVSSTVVSSPYTITGTAV
ncbi:MAG: hypothetical protein KAR06_08970, partial [Deltaproteobacteria bacterium]|nr:hypothetical protein [Deltaproteobacteria bacterium]